MRVSWRRVGSILADGLLAVMSLGLALLLAEAVLRMRHGPPPPPPSPTPYRVLTTRGSRLIPGTRVFHVFESTTTPVWVRVNTLGLRGPEVPEAGPKVLFLGDSITFGYGVEEDSCFVAVAGRVWRASGLGLHAVNAGLEDAGIVEERMLLEEVGERVGPAAVVVCFYPNDSRPPVGFRQEYLEEDPFDRWLRTHPALARHSRVVGFVHYRYRRLLDRWHLARSPIPERFKWIDLWREGTWRHSPSVAESLVAMAAYDWGAGWREEGWQTVREELGKIRQWCLRRGVGLGVCYLPVQVEVEGPFSSSVPAARLHELCAAWGIPFMDTFPLLKGCARCFMDHCHLTPQGHLRVGEAMARWVTEWVGRS